MFVVEKDGENPLAFFSAFFEELLRDFITSLYILIYKLLQIRREEWGGTIGMRGEHRLNDECYGCESMKRRENFPNNFLYLICAFPPLLANEYLHQAHKSIPK